MTGVTGVPSSLFGHAAQRALVVLSAVENPNDHHFGFLHLENDGGTPLKAHCSETRTDVVVPRTSLGKGRQRHAGGLDAIDVGASKLIAGFLGDIAIEPEEISFREWTKAELKFFHSARPSPAPRDAYANV